MTGLALLLFAAYFSIAAAIALSLISVAVFTYRYYKNYVPRQAPAEISKEMTSVYLFKRDEKNKGVSVESVRALEKSNSGIACSLKVVLCNDDKMTPSNFDERGIVIFLGGKCSEWNELLSDETQMKIHQWFKNGGRIFWYMCRSLLLFEKIFLSAYSKN